MYFHFAITAVSCKTVKIKSQGGEAEKEILHKTHDIAIGLTRPTTCPQGTPPLPLSRVEVT